MHSISSMRLTRILTTLIPLAILMGCGEGDGKPSIAGTPAPPPPPPPPASCNDFVGFEDVCPAGTFTEFEGGVAFVTDNPDATGINTSAKVAQMQKFEATSGATFGGTTLALPTSLTVAAGSSFTMKVWSQRAVVVLFQPEPQGPGTGIEVTHGGTGWEELTFSLPAIAGTVDGITIIFDNGTLGDADNDAVNWTFYVDEITLIPPGGGGGGGGGAVPAALPVDFEGATDSYDFGVDGGFDGGAASVVVNPDQSGINTSAQVGQMLKFPGQVFGGATLVIEDTTVAAGSSFTMKVWSQRSVPVLLQPEPQGPGSGAEVVHGGTGWEELTFSLPGLAGTVSGITIIFDNGTAGAADTDPTNWTFYFDDIVLVPPGGGGGGGGSADIDFESGATGAAFTWNVFENDDNPALNVISNPDPSGANTSSMVAEFTARVGGQPFAGTITNDLPTFTLDASNSTVTIKVWKSVISDVGIKFENATGGSTGEIKVANTVTDQWEELTFDFSGVIGDPNNTDITGLVIFPDFDLAGRTQDNVVYFDDITFAAQGGGGGGTSSSQDFESGPVTFLDFNGGVAAAVPNPDATGLNTSATVGQMQKFAGDTFGGSTLDLGGSVALAAGDSYTMLVRATRAVPVTFKLEPLNEERVADHSGSGTWEELCFDFTGVAGDVTGYTIIFDNGVVGDAAGDPDNWTFQFDDIQQVSSCPTGGGGGSVAVDFESDATGAAFTWNIFENGDNPPLNVISNPDPSGANTSATVGEFTARVAGQPFAGTITTDLPTFTLDASNAFVKIKVWKSVISDVGIKFENAAAGSTGEIRVANTVTDQWEELTFDFSGVIGDPNNTDITGLVIFPDFDARAQDNVVYFDDISFSADGGGGGGGTAGTLLVSFDEAMPPAVTVFGGATTAIEAGPTGGDGNALRLTRDGGDVFAGAWVPVAGIPNDAGTQTVSALVYSPTAGVPMVAKLEFADNAGTGDTSANETVVVGWQTLTWTFTNLAPPNDYNRFVILPNLGTVDTATDYYFDNITLDDAGAGGGGGGGNSSLVNGDFETGDLSDWTQTQVPTNLGSIAADSSGQGGRAGTVARLVASGSDVIGSNDVLITQTLAAGTVQAGDSIDVSFDLYGSLTGAGGVVFVEIIFLDAAGQDVGGRDFVGPAAPYVPTTTWTPYSGTVIAGTATGGGLFDVSGGITLSLKVACGAIVNGCGVDASFDDVTLTIN